VLSTSPTHPVTGGASTRHSVKPAWPPPAAGTTGGGCDISPSLTETAEKNEYSGIEYAELPVEPALLQMQDPPPPALRSGPTVVQRRAMTCTTIGKGGSVGRSSGAWRHGWSRRVPKTTPAGERRKQSDHGIEYAGLPVNCVLFTLQTCFKARSPPRAAHCICSVLGPVFVGTMTVAATGFSSGRVVRSPRSPSGPACW
jgi:hypothetical protein